MCRKNGEAKGDWSLYSVSITFGNHFSLSLTFLVTFPFASPLFRERKFSPKFFWPKFLKIPWGSGCPRLRVMDVRAEMLVFQDFEGPDRSFGPGYPREWPPDVRGISVPKTSSLGCFFVLDFCGSHSAIAAAKSFQSQLRIARLVSRWWTISKCWGKLKSSFAKGSFSQMRAHWLAGCFACPHPIPHPPPSLPLLPRFLQANHTPQQPLPLRTPRGTRTFCAWRTP